MSKLKIDQDKIALETKTQVLSEVQKAVHHFLYDTRSPEADPTVISNISTIQLFQLIQNKTVTTSDIINTFAKELRREVE